MKIKPNGSLVSKLTGEFKLQGEDKSKFEQLVRLFHDESVEGDCSFDEAINKLDFESAAAKAFDKYTKTPPTKLRSYLAIVAFTWEKIYPILKDTAKKVILTTIRDWQYTEKLYQRMLVFEVGYISGHVSEIDKHYAQENHLKPLSAFEKWLTKELAEHERKQRHIAWSNIMDETMMR